MQIETFSNFILPFGNQIRWPVCEDTEGRWGNYLIRYKRAGEKIAPVQLRIWSMSGVDAQAIAIQKYAERESNSYLILSPYLGILTSKSGQLYRPLLAYPRGDYHEKCVLAQAIEEEYSLRADHQGWFVQGFAQLLTDTIEGGIDVNDLMETMYQYELYLQQYPIFAV